MKYILDIDKIRQLGKRSGFNTLKDLCAEASVHYNSITPYIKKERSPFTQVVLDIASALKVSAKDLICKDEEREISSIISSLPPLLGPGQAIFLFGSRARGTQKKFSDVDLGITGGRDKMSFSLFCEIKSSIDDLFEDSPLSINLINLDLAPLSFLEEIEKDMRFICGDEKSANYFLGVIDGRKKN